jgi:glycosyltransferase involved in cell wall biosynthesis
MNSPLVSIVALCYNQEKFVLETLNSIVNQDYSNIELIIIDDCSKDHSVKIIREFISKSGKSIQFVQNIKNLGLIKNVSKGFSIVNGKYYQILGCDDVLLPNKISTQVEIFEKKLDSSYAVVYGDICLMDEDGRVSDVSKFDSRGWDDIAEVPHIIYEKLAVQNIIPASSVLVRTDTVRRLNGYSTAYSFEDRPLWLKLSRQGFKFYPIQEALVKARIHSNSMTGSPKRKYLLDNLKLNRDEYSKSGNPGFLKNSFKTYKKIQKNFPGLFTRVLLICYALLFRDRIFFISSFKIIFNPSYHLQKSEV